MNKIYIQNIENIYKKPVKYDFWEVHQPNIK